MSVPVCFPPWVLIDDDGREVMLVDTSEQPGRPRLVDERELFHGLLTKLRDAAPEQGAQSLSEPEARLLESLRGSAHIVDVAESTPDWSRPDTVGSPFLGHATIELEVTDDAERTVVAASDVVARLLDSPRDLRGLVVRGLVPDGPLDWRGISEVLGRVVDALEQGCASRERETPSWICEIPVAPRFVPEEAYPVLEEGGRCRAVLRAANGGAPEEQDVEACLRLSKEGFECIVEVTTDFEDAVEDIVATWFDDGGCSAVRIVPRFGRPPYEGLSTKALRARVDRALAALASIADRLGTNVQRSQPWRSILTAALVPWPGSTGWSKVQSRVHVDGDGRLARSPRHARGGFHEPLERLLPGADDWAARADRDSRLTAGPSFAGAPDCPSCGFAPMCDKYGSPDVDLALRHGRTDVAAELARYECELRVDTLGRLLDSLRARAQEDRVTRGLGARTLVHFEQDTGEVTLDSR